MMLISEKIFIKPIKKYSMQRKNEYELFAHEGEVEGICEMVEHIYLYRSSNESIEMSIGKNGIRYFYGYAINFQNSRRAERKIGENAVWFDEPKSAKRYFMGYILQYREYFSDDCIKEIKKKLLETFTLPLI